MAGLYTPDGREATLKHVETTDSLSQHLTHFCSHSSWCLHTWRLPGFYSFLSVLVKPFGWKCFWPFCARNKTIRPELKWHFGCNGDIASCINTGSENSESKVGDGCNIHRQILVVCVRICWAMIPYLWISVSYVDLRISHHIEISDYKKLSGLHIIMSHLANGQLLNFLGNTLVPYQ